MHTCFKIEFQLHLLCLLILEVYLHYQLLSTSLYILDCIHKFLSIGMIDKDCRDLDLVSFDR